MRIDRSCGERIMHQAFSIVTKTYRGDAAAFADLCRSIDLHMPHILHHVLVDRSDLPLFAAYASDHRRVIDCTSFLPAFHEFNILGKRFWFRWPSRVVRGWIQQQLAKIAYTSTLDEAAVLLIDSDALFIRPVPADKIFSDGKVKLWRQRGGGCGPEHSKWHDVAMKSYGLPLRGYTGFDYISNAVIWDPAIVREMIGCIERNSGLRWYDALSANFRFSEYIQYGVFCDHVEGQHQDGVVRVEDELCHCSWHYDIGSSEGMANFAASIRDHHCAVLIQSNLKLSQDRRRALLSAVSAAVE